MEGQIQSPQRTCGIVPFPLPNVSPERERDEAVGPGIGDVSGSGNANDLAMPGAQATINDPAGQILQNMMAASAYYQQLEMLYAHMVRGYRNPADGNTGDEISQLKATVEALSEEIKDLRNDGRTRQAVDALPPRYLCGTNLPADAERLVAFLDRHGLSTSGFSCIRGLRVPPASGGELYVVVSPMLTAHMLQAYYPSLLGSGRQRPQIAHVTGIAGQQLPFRMLLKTELELYERYVGVMPFRPCRKLEDKLRDSLWMPAAVFRDIAFPLRARWKRILGEPKPDAETRLSLPPDWAHTRIDRRSLKSVRPEHLDDPAYARKPAWAVRYWDELLGGDLNALFSCMASPACAESDLAMKLRRSPDNLVHVDAGWVPVDLPVLSRRQVAQAFHAGIRSDAGRRASRDGEPDRPGISADAPIAPALPGHGGYYDRDDDDDEEEEEHECTDDDDMRDDDYVPSPSWRSSPARTARGPSGSPAEAEDGVLGSDTDADDEPVRCRTPPSPPPGFPKTGAPLRGAEDGVRCATRSTSSARTPNPRAKASSVGAPNKPHPTTHAPPGRPNPPHSRFPLLASCFVQDGWVSINDVLAAILPGDRKRANMLYNGTLKSKLDKRWKKKHLRCLTNSKIRGGRKVAMTDVQGLRRLMKVALGSHIPEYRKRAVAEFLRSEDWKQLGSRLGTSSTTPAGPASNGATPDPKARRTPERKRLHGGRAPTGSRPRAAAPSSDSAGSLPISDRARSTPSVCRRSPPPPPPGPDTPSLRDLARSGGGPFVSKPAASATADSDSHPVATSFRRAVRPPTEPHSWCDNVPHPTSAAAVPPAGRMPPFVGSSAQPDTYPPTSREPAITFLTPPSLERRIFPDSPDHGAFRDGHPESCADTVGGCWPTVAPDRSAAIRADSLLASLQPQLGFPQNAARISAEPAPLPHHPRTSDRLLPSKPSHATSPAEKQRRYSRRPPYMRHGLVSIRDLIADSTGLSSTDAGNLWTYDLPRHVYRRLAKHVRTSGATEGLAWARMTDRAGAVAILDELSSCSALPEGVRAAVQSFRRSTDWTWLLGKLCDSP